MWQGLGAFDGNAAPTFALPLSEAFMRAGYAMGEQQQPDADRALLVDHFTKMDTSKNPVVTGGRGLVRLG